MDNTIIAAIIGGLCVIAAAFVGVWFQQRKKGKTDDNRTSPGAGGTPTVKVGEKAKTGDININSPHGNTTFNLNRE